MSFPFPNKLECLTVNSRRPGRLFIMIRLLRDCLLSISILEMLVLGYFVSEFILFIFVVVVAVPSLNPQTH